MTKKRRLLQSDTFWGLAAALVVILQFWWLPGEDGSAADSYSTTVDGKLGLYRTLSELFPNVERDAFQVVPEETACLVLTAPDRYPNDREQSDLYQFVYSGGTLVFAPNWDEPECEMRSLGIQTTNRVGAASTTAVPSAPSSTTTPGATSTPADAAEQNSTPEAEAMKKTKSAAQLEMDAIPPNQQQKSGQSAEPLVPDKDEFTSPDELLKKQTPGLTPPTGLDTSLEDPENFSRPGETVDVASRLVDGSVEWNTSADLNVPTYLATETLVKSSSDHIEVATWPMGNGRIIACSSADIFSNRSMLFSDSRRLAVRLIELGVLHSDAHSVSDTPIVISEYFNASDSYAQTGVLFSPSLRIGTLQLVLVALLGIWLAFYRFGPAQEVSTLQRRSLTESAQAVGNLQYRLNDGGAVIRSYLEYIRSQLRRRYGSFVRMDQPETLANRAGMDAGEVRDRLAEAQTLAETVQLSPEKTAASLRWLSILQQRLTGTRNENSS